MKPNPYESPAGQELPPETALRAAVRFRDSVHGIVTVNALLLGVSMVLTVGCVLLDLPLPTPWLPGSYLLLLLSTLLFAPLTAYAQRSVQRQFLSGTGGG